jgi:hypothetical protein
MSSAVCDSGPLTHLWQIQQWSAFAVFSELHVANQVAVEVREHVHLDQFTAMTNCQLTLHSVDQTAQLRQAIDDLFVHSTLYLSPLFRHPL